MTYRPPVDDIVFALEHLAGYDEIAALPGFEESDIEVARELLTEAGRLVAEEIAPLNRTGDKVGAVRNPDSTVTTPPGFKEAYATFRDAGWPGLAFPAEYGGAGLPSSLGLAIHELLMGSSMSFGLGPLLTQGAIEAIEAYGSDELKSTYLPHMVTGEWMGTMNLTEPHAGTDVGAITTKAVKNEDGSYSITGTKIFITYGEHDFTKQIVHLVLAKLPGAPAGTRGISCFIVPKYLLDENGQPGERNSAYAIGVEEKLGIHGSPTCTMQYDGATGYLIGEENLGMRIMFVMMNSARLSVGVQGVGVGERAYQESLEYARQRVQGNYPDGGPMTIVDIPDVRRMLVTQKAWITALRGLMFTTSGQIDRSRHAADEAERKRASDRVGVLIPLAKSMGTDLGVELASIALQVYGGAGYIEETGAAQHYRDVRITPIYEGTNGVQAADLVTRKIDLTRGQAIADLVGEIAAYQTELAVHPELDEVRVALADAAAAAATASRWIVAAPVESRLAASVAYQRLLGTVVCGWVLARSAVAAKGTGLEVEKRELARFFAQQILPTAQGLLPAATAGAESVYALPSELL